MTATGHTDALLAALRSNLDVLNELAVRYEVELRPERDAGAPATCSPQDVQRLLGPEMGALAQEQVRVLLLDHKNHVTGQRVIYQGNAYSAVVRPAEVLRPAVVEAAVHIIVVHNHPSGDASPAPRTWRSRGNWPRQRICSASPSSTTSSSAAMRPSASRTAGSSSPAPSRPDGCRRPARTPGRASRSSQSTTQCIRKETVHARRLLGDHRPHHRRAGARHRAGGVRRGAHAGTATPAPAAPTAASTRWCWR